MQVKWKFQMMMTTITLETISKISAYKSHELKRPTDIGTGRQPIQMVSQNKLWFVCLFTCFCKQMFVVIRRSIPHIARENVFHCKLAIRLYKLLFAQLEWRLEKRDRILYRINQGLAHGTKLWVAYTVSLPNIETDGILNRWKSFILHSLKERKDWTY